MLYNNNKNIKRSILLFVLIICKYVAPAYANKEYVNPPLQIDTSYSQESFSPQRGENVSIRYQITKQADLTLLIYGPDGRVYYHVTKKAAPEGYGEFIWKGVDNEGHRLPPEAYRYRIIAKDGGRTVVSNTKDFIGGRELQITQISINENTDTLGYFLSRPARVRIMAKLKKGSVPLGTLLDWEARPAGYHSEKVNLDHYKKLFPGEEIVPYLTQAWAIPENAIIIMPKTGLLTRNKYFTWKYQAKGDIRPWYKWNNMNVQQHATHKYNQCYDPKIRMIPLNVKYEKNITIKAKNTTTFRLTAPEDQGQGRVPPIPRLSIFVFVDNTMVTRVLPAYLPYQWQFDPTKYVDGEHVITAMLSWRDEHIGIAHQRIVVPEGVGTKMTIKDKLK